MQKLEEHLRKHEITRHQVMESDFKNPCPSRTDKYLDEASIPERMTKSENYPDPEENSKGIHPQHLETDKMFTYDVEKS